MGPITIRVSGTMTTKQINGVKSGLTTSGIHFSTRRSNQESAHTRNSGGKTEEVYTVLESGKKRKLMLSPPAIRPASAAQSGLISAQQQRTAINGLHLKWRAAVMAIKTGRKANGVQDIKLSTAKVPVVLISASIRLTTISSPCRIPAAARM